MDQPRTTKDGKPVAAWLLKANPDVYDVDTAYERFGVMTSWSLSPTYRLELMAPGQRCFLYRTGGSHGGFSGIIAAGVITGEVYTDRGGRPELWRNTDKATAAAPYVPVELHLLKAPISRDELIDDPVLRELEVIRAPQMSNPTVVRPDHLARLDERDLSVTTPTEEQLAELDDELDEGDGIWFLLPDGESAYALVESDEVEEAWRIVRMDDGVDGEEALGDGLGWAQAFKSLGSIASEVGRRAPVITPVDESDDEDQDMVWDPVAMFPGGDGSTSVFRIDKELFVAYAVDDGDLLDEDPIGSWDDLGRAIVDLAEEVGEPAFEPWDEDADQADEG